MLDQVTYSKVIKDITDSLNVVLNMSCTDDRTMEVFSDALRQYWELSAALIITGTPKSDEYNALTMRVDRLVGAFGRSGLYCSTLQKNRALRLIEEAEMMIAASTKGN